MSYYVIFTKVVTLTLTVTRILPKNCDGVLGPEYINCKNFRNIGPVVWPVRSRTDGQTNRQTDKQTNRQTDRQTNRGDQYTLQKSTILQSNERTTDNSTLANLRCLSSGGAKK